MISPGTAFSLVRSLVRRASARRQLGATRASEATRGARSWARRAAAAGVLAGAVGGPLFVATGCDCRAVVTAKSPVLGDVRVQIAGAGGLCGSDLGLGDFEVYRDSTELVWAAAFTGSNNYPTVRELKYGTPPPGFTEEQAAAPLAVDDAIEFRVHGPGFRGEVALVVTAP